MTALELGTKNVRALYLGARRVSRVMLGSKLVWNSATVFDDFNRANSKLDAKDWVNAGPSFDHVASVVDGKMRIDIPDGLMDPFGRISYMRYTKALAPADDGYIECLVSTMGDSTPGIFADIVYRTTLFGKVSNTGFSEGVGISLSASGISLTVRNGLIDREVKTFGSYAPLDVIRLTFVGKLYTMYRNGASLGTWTDSSNQVETGAGYRSMGIRVDGAKEMLGLGPRRFSPALDYVEYG
jgi:hypothetical protein